MKVLILSVLSLLIFTSTLFSAGLKSSDKKKNLTENLLVVKFKKTESQSKSIGNLKDQFSSILFAEKVSPFISEYVNQAVAENIGIDRIFIYSLPPGSNSGELASKLNSFKEIEYAEPVFFAKTTDVSPGMQVFPGSISTTPNDPLIPNLHPLTQVGAFNAWDVQKGDSNVVLAIIDTGVDWDHEDLAGSIWNNPGETGLDLSDKDKRTNGVDDDGNGKIDDFMGWDFVETSSNAAAGEDKDIEDNNPMDFNGHGSHVAGIAGGQTDNGVGIASLSWGVKILPIRIGYHTADGQGSSNSLFQSRAFIYAADMGADALNMSFTNGGKLIEDAGRYATEKGTLVIISAGNDDNDNPSELDVHPWAISVSSVAKTDKKAYYSSYGSWVKISAPGGDQSSSNLNGFLSTVPYPSSLYGNKKYEYFQGTSMASPFVASLAGLIKSKFPDITLIELAERIKQSADNIDALNPGYKGKLGAGRINAFKALTLTGLEPAKPKIYPVSQKVVDQGGNSNGIINIGESFDLKIELKNDWGKAENLNVTLASSDGWPLVINNPIISIGSLSEVTDVSGSSSEIVFNLSCEPDGLPRMLNYNLILSADNGYLDTIKIQLAVEPQFLVIADFDDGPNYSKNYQKLLSQNNFSFDLVQRGSVTLTKEKLNSYQAVIWAVGWSFPSFNSDDRTLLADFINSGGSLLVSGQDLGWDLADPTGTEYIASGGSSKTWFETYLKSEFLGDDNNQTEISGVKDDLLGNGISSGISMPEIPATNQYPDYVSPKGGSSSFLVYPNGQTAGIRFQSGLHKLVYLPFGGLEAVTDQDAANQLTTRILTYLSGFNVVFNPVNNTENTSDPVEISVEISGSDPINSADLYFSTTGAFPFSKTSMEKSGTVWSGQIPSAPLGTSVYYFFVGKTESGSLTPYTIYQYSVKIDEVKPVVNTVHLLKNTLENGGNYPVAIQISDESGIKVGTVQLHFTTSTGYADSTLLSSVGSDNWFTGSILIPPPVASNTIVSYFFTASDASIAQNSVRSPESGSFDFEIGREMMDDFETDLAWSFDGAFGITSKRKVSGGFSLHNNKGTNYVANSNTTATLNLPLNFTGYSKPAIAFYSALRFGKGDTCFVEINSGNEWKKVASIAVTDASMWAAFSRKVIFLPDYGGKKDVQLRYHFISNSDHSGTNFGIYIDNLEVIGDTSTVTSAENERPATPSEFSLSQNYPNPFNPITSFYYELPEPAFVKILIYDALGREVKTVISGFKPSGVFKETIDGSQLSSGIYIYVVEAGTRRLMKKMVLMK
ncbi:MAG: S8 family peptidase [Bacteroidetes bacterium]|nr:S8 family peptidase [Bacteroidota bacterium]